MTAHTQPRPRRSVPRPREQFDPARPFTREEAVAAGITHRALLSPRFVRLLHGVYVASTVRRTPELVAEALLLVAPGPAWVSHASAARLLGLPLPVLPEEHLTVIAKADRMKRRGVRCHLGSGDATVVRRQGLVHSAPAQVFVELAELLPLVDLVVVGDWMVRRQMLTLAELRSFVDLSHLKGARAARLAVAYVRERADSPMETRLRMLFVLAGFPEPEVNLAVNLGEGLRRYDLCWPGVKVIAEYDGRHHAEREEQWEADLERREQIDDDEWRIRVFVARDIYNTPDRTLHRMAALLRAKRLPGMPRCLRDDWRAHFPVRDSYL